MTSKIRALVVDDSAVFRRLLTDVLSRDPALEVVGTAADGFIAERKIMALRPDVVTLDVVMPGLDGLTVLDHLMEAGPLPVVMISGITDEACDVTLQALERGAVDFICKSHGDLTSWLSGAAEEITEKVKHAAKARLRSLPRRSRPTPSMLRATPGKAPAIVAVGASTGGTEAIAELLMELPADAPPMVIVQHMPRAFTRRFAERCNMHTAVRVKEAEAGEEIVPGLALIAPGGFHLRVRRRDGRYEVALDEQPPVNRHRPSVDVLFESVAQAAGRRAVGVLLTGMGSDGARGLLAMRRTGARTIAQDEKSCVVFGMPREAIEMGGAGTVLPLSRIARAILDSSAGAESPPARTGGASYALDN
jgi:two-component system, chemotaxis family, protein-glutamate methylesterase/glutaminase